MIHQKIDEVQRQQLVEYLQTQYVLRCKERDELRAEVERLKESLLADGALMREVVERWDTPLWKDAPATAVVIGKLRERLEQK